MTLNLTDYIIAGVVVGVPLIFTLGRFSTRVAWFHAKTEQKYSVPEFMRDHQ